MRLRRVVERLHERMPFQRRLHEAALYPFPAAMDQPHFPQASLVRRADIFLDNRAHVARRERVQVEFGLYRDRVGNVRRRLQWNW